jgi:hypothetical protein
LYGEYSPVARKKSANLFTQYEHAVDLEHKGGVESKVGEKLADYVFKDWKKHTDKTYVYCFPKFNTQEAADSIISSAHGRFKNGEFATTL